jgi:predicted dienelactone hydrolase
MRQKRGSAKEPAEFMKAVWIEKPAPLKALLDALANLQVEPKRQQG